MEAKIDLNRAIDSIVEDAEQMKPAYGLYLRSQAGAPTIEADDEDLRNKIQTQ